VLAGAEGGWDVEKQAKWQSRVESIAHAQQELSARASSVPFIGFGRGAWSQIEDAVQPRPAQPGHMRRYAFAQLAG